MSFAVIVVDQITKALAVRFLSPIPSLPVIPGIFHLTFLRNAGVAFGLFKDHGFPIIFVTFGIVLTLFWVSLRSRDGESGLMVLCLGLILGGAVGNLIDRIRTGGVIDFLDFRIWPVFNMADSCITIGAVLMTWMLLRSRRA